MNPIPPATAEKLATEFPPGTRHQAKVDICIPLVANGLPDSAVFMTIKDKFPNSTDREINGIIRWVKEQSFTPTGTNGAGPVTHSRPRAAATVNAPIQQRTPIEQIDWWTNEAAVTPERMAESSPMGIPTDPVEAAVLAFSSLYQSTDFSNIVCKYVLDGGKARPVGGGRILNRDQWIAYFQANGVPSSDAGAWIRLNPCNPTGTGHEGAVTDADIASFRYVLIEFDSVPISKQLALFHRWKLPVAAVILSGGASAHAWVKVDAKDGKDYRDLADRLYSVLKPFGIDQANKNPSRLCRLPGAVRKIGATDGGEQRLLWLNPNVQPLTADILKQFEDTLAFPCVDEFPLRKLAVDAIGRYEWMANNRGKLGVPSGIPELDRLSGGFKSGQTIVVAGETGGGKSTLGLHIVTTALNAGYGVLLFSLEMDKEEIFDLILSGRASVNRNTFNNGEFTDADFAAMTREMPAISKLPLYIEDSSLTGADQIKARVMQLKTDGKIGLVVVDYIQFVNPGLTKDNREQQVAQISHTLRSVAREAKIPMVILSQLNDEGRLRESRVISHNANVVMVVKVDNDDFTVSVVKGRGIPTGDYQLHFDRQYARLLPKPKIDPSDYPYSRCAHD